MMPAMDRPPSDDYEHRRRKKAGIAVLLLGIAICILGVSLAFARAGEYAGSPFDGMHLWALPGAALVTGGVLLLRDGGGA
jgi:hypothetical protein